MNFVWMTANNDKPPASAPSGGRNASSTSASKPGKGEGAFDLWLHRGLHKLFDDVANEPIPEELLRLIEDDRKAR